MSTHCAVIVKQGESDYAGIYCHFDGYADGVGATLKRAFSSRQDAMSLVALGDCSSISGCVRIIPLGEHSYSSPEDGTVVAYYRDRREKWENVKPKFGKTWKLVADQIDHCGYVYVWNKGKWRKYRSA